nr:ADP-ribosyltransferase [uncultured Romboutsia sp.]
MPILPKKIDFRDESKLNEARTWGKNEESKWKKQLTLQQQKSVEKLKYEDSKIKIYDYSKSMNFFSDVVSEIEESQAKREELSDIKRLKESLLKNTLSQDVFGYAKISQNELGINYNIKNDFSNETISKIKNQIINKSFKKFDFLEIDMTSEHLNLDLPIIVSVRVPMGLNYGIMNSESNLSLLLDKGFVIQPRSVKVSSIKGKNRIFVDADINNVLDFSDAKNVTWGEENYRNFRDKLTADEANAISLYIKRDYQAINDYLRKGKQPNNKELNKKIELISNALSKKPIPEDVVVYRRVGLDIFGYPISHTFDNKDPKIKQKLIDEFINKYNGKTIKNLAYSSTSLSSADVSSFQPRKAIFRLTVPKGTKAAYITGFDEYASEKEIILDKNSNFEIYRITPITEIHPGNKSVTKLVIDAIVRQ